jgi:hypothetical protein
MTVPEDIKKTAMDTWLAFQKTADAMKQKLLDAAGETKDTASSATRAVLNRIDTAVQWSKDHLPK